MQIDAEPPHHALRGEARRTRRCRTRLTLPRGLVCPAGHRRRATSCSWPPWAFTSSTATSSAELLDNTLTDFGKHIIPAAIEHARVFSYVFQGYWEDIGTIRAFFEANLDVTVELPRFNFFDMTAPDLQPAALPARLEDQRRADRPRRDLRRLHHQRAQHHAQHHRPAQPSSAPAARISRTVMLGSDYYESLESIREHETPASRASASARTPASRTPSSTRTRASATTWSFPPRASPTSVDHPLYYIRDGIVIIPKNGVIPHGTVI